MIPIELTSVQIDQILDLLAILGLPTLFAAYLVYQDKKKHRPIDATATVAQGGADLVGVSNGLVETLIARIENLEGRVTTAETRISTQDITIANQSSEISLLRLVITIWSNWWMDLEARWDYHRSKDAPPPRPITPIVEDK